MQDDGTWRLTAGLRSNVSLHIVIKVSRMTGIPSDARNIWTRLACKHISSFVVTQKPWLSNHWTETVQSAQLVTHQCLCTISHPGQGWLGDPTPPSDRSVSYVHHCF